MTGGAELGDLLLPVLGEAPGGGGVQVGRCLAHHTQCVALSELLRGAPAVLHNGIAATLEDVVELYDSRKALGLTAEQKADLVQYLKSL